MQIGLSLFSIYIAPLIALIAWGISIFRLRSRFLTALSLIVIVLIAISTFNPFFVALRNPYLLLTLIALALFNTIVIPYASQNDRPYLIAADTVLILMILALHGWTIYLRQSDAYFYERTDYWAFTFPVLISLLSISIPVVTILQNIDKTKAFRRSVLLIIVAIVLALLIGII